MKTYKIRNMDSIDASTVYVACGACNCADGTSRMGAMDQPASSSPPIEIRSTTFRVTFRRLRS